jgi:hypothetical protein
VTGQANMVKGPPERDSDPFHVVLAGLRQRTLVVGAILALVQRPIMSRSAHSRTVNALG